MNLMGKITEFGTVAGTYIVDFAASVAMSLILPAFVSLETYATLRVYLLYASFVSVLNFGFNDGVYVKYGAFDYDGLPKQLINAFIRHVAFQGILFGVIVTFVGLIGVPDVDAIVAVFLGVNLFVLNLNGLFIFINQFTRRFSTNLTNNLLAKAVQIILVLIVIITRLDNPYFIIAAISASNFTCLCLNAVNNKELIQAGLPDHESAKSALAVCYRSGIAIMIGYYASQLILSAGQFVASATCTAETFAYFSFAFSIMNFLNVFVNSVSTWLYPSLKRIASSAAFRRVACVINIACSCGMVALLECGFILAAFVSMAIPRYEGSIEYFFVLFPSVAFSGVIKMVFGNMYKVCERERQYMTLNISAAIMSVILVAAVSAVFPGQPLALAHVTTLTIIIQYLLLIYGIRDVFDSGSAILGPLVILAGFAWFTLVACMGLDYMIMAALYLPVALVVACFMAAISRGEIKDL